MNRKNNRFMVLAILLLVFLYWIAVPIFSGSHFDSGLSYFHSFSEMTIQQLGMHVIISLVFLITCLYFIRIIFRLHNNLRQSRSLQEKYSMIADHTNDVIWTMDLNGNFTYVSPSVQRLRGFEPPEIIKQSLADTMTPSSFALISGLVERFKELINSDPPKKPSVVTEVEQIRKDGSTVWTEASVTTIMDSKGRAEFFLGVSRDISDRKRRERDLRQSEENYRLLAETTSDYILVHDMEGYITYANKAAIDSLGYSMDELVGKQLRDMIPEHDQKRVDNYMNLRNKGDLSKFLYEIEFRHSSEYFIPMEINSAPILLNKEPLAILITARDISARKEAEQQLVDNEKRFRSYIENSPVPLFILSSDGMIVYANDAAVEVLAYPAKADLLTIHFSDICTKCDLSLNKDFANTTHQRESHTLEATIRTLKGTEKNVLIRSSALANDQMMVYTLDISERIIAEEKIREKTREIERLNSGLEEMVKTRTSELHKANKELEAFSYSVSHDLRAPLRHINVFSKLLLPKLGKSQLKAEEYVNSIVTSVGRMNNLIDDILLFSRVGKTELHKYPFEMTPLVEQVIEENAYEYTGREISWQIEQLGEVVGDRKLIKMVWTNLITNAIKFTRNTNPVKVKIGKKNADTYYISDNGVGFNPEFKEKLFGVFQRLHSESEFEGTGIGLANVKRIVDRHGGIVSAEGELNKGAIFSFSLPHE